MTKAKTIEKKAIEKKTIEKKTIEKKAIDEPNLIESNDAELLELRAKVEELESIAREKKELESKLEELTSEDKVEPIEYEMATYTFTNIYDPGVSFSGTYGAPAVKGGKNVYTRYSCEDGESVELPVAYAEELNKCRIPLVKWDTNESGNSIKKHSVSDRFIFRKVV